MKKLKVFLSLLVALTCLVTALTIAISAEEPTGEEVKKITISYVDESNTTSTTTSLDKKAHTDGKITVNAGEKFTLPTTSNVKNAGVDGYMLVWYTEDGRTYNAGEEVSFDEDTRLFRSAPKKVSTESELIVAFSSGEKSAILTADISLTNLVYGVEQNHSYLFLNGYNITASRNGCLFGSKRAGKHIYGEGTITVTAPTGKGAGANSVMECSSHSYGGGANVTIIGRDVVLNAPEYNLIRDTDGATTSHYPWVRVYGSINVYSLATFSNSNNRAPHFEFFEGCQVTINSNTLFATNAGTLGQSMDVDIYGGTFNLPAAASDVNFWMQSETDLTNYLKKDRIAIYGGNFITADGSVPAISPYLGKSVYAIYQTAGEGLYNNKGNTTMNAYYYDGKVLNRNAYVFVFEKDATGEDIAVDGITQRIRDGNLTITDNIDGSISGTYLYKIVYNKNTWAILSFEITNTDGTAITDFKYELGLANFAFYTEGAVVEKSIAQFEVDSKEYTTVVPGGCEHNYVGEPVAATCQHVAYADYNCSKCAHNVYFSWGTKTDHSYVVSNKTVASVSNLGFKKFGCENCTWSIEKPYTIDPSNLEVSVTIRNDDGTFSNTTVFASDIFEFSIQGDLESPVYILSAIKAFDEYSIRNIYGITIPAGIMYVKITTQNQEKYQNAYYGVEELIIPDNANIDILNIGNLRELKTIKVGSANVKFAINCNYYSPNDERRATKITTLDISASNSNIVFESSAFSDRTTLTTLKLGKNSTYTFGSKCFYKGSITELSFDKSNSYTLGSESFYGNDFEELIIPDNATNITFTGDGAFRDCTTKYLYIGKNFVLDYIPFQYMLHLEKIVIMDGVKFTTSKEWAFVRAGTSDLTTPLYVYNHSTDLTFYKGMFGTNESKYPMGGIFLYTVTDGIGTRTDVFNSCTDVKTKDADGNEVVLYKAWTIYLGIPHSYTNIVDPTCTENGGLDCPCGVYEWSVHDNKWGYATFVEDINNPGTGTGTVAYKMYESVHNIKLGTASDTTVTEDTTLDGTQKTYVILPALGHNMESVITAPKCLEDGEENMVCQREGCNHFVFVRVIDKTGHTMIYTIEYPGGFDVQGDRVDKCRDCDDVTTTTKVEAILVARGYSISPNLEALSGGYTVNIGALKAYECVNGELSYGVIVANANAEDFGDSFFVNGKVNTTKAIQVPITMKVYSNFDCTLSGFGVNSSTLELVICAYVIDAEGNVSFVQAENDYAIATEIGGQSFTKVTFDLVVANVVDQPDALVPTNKE